MLYLLPVLLFAYANAEGPGCNSVVITGAYGYPTDSCVVLGDTSSQEFTCADDDTITYNLYSTNDCSGDATTLEDYCSGGTVCTGYCGQTGTCGVVTLSSYAATDCTGDVQYEQSIITDYCGGGGKFTCGGGSVSFCANTGSACDNCVDYGTECYAGIKWSCDSSGAALSLFVTVIAVFIASLF